MVIHGWVDNLAHVVCTDYRFFLFLAPLIPIIDFFHCTVPTPVVFYWYPINHGPYYKASNMSVLSQPQKLNI